VKLNVDYKRLFVDPANTAKSKSKNKRPWEL
jgi:hypothetical protein